VWRRGSAQRDKPAGRVRGRRLARVQVNVTCDCRYSNIAGSYVVPKTVSLVEPPKSKSAKPQEWKAVVGKLPAGADPTKAAKIAPASNTSAPSKNVKGGSTTTAARKPLVSRN
jgi:hypothetical protein